MGFAVENSSSPGQADSVGSGPLQRKHLQQGGAESAKNGLTQPSGSSRLRVQDSKRSAQLFFTAFCLFNLIILSVLNFLEFTDTQVRPVQWSLLALGIAGIYLCCMGIFQRAWQELKSLAPQRSFLLALGILVYLGLVVSELTLLTDNQMPALFVEGFLLAVILIGLFDYFEALIHAQISQAFYFVPEIPQLEVKSIEDERDQSPEIVPVDSITGSTLLLFEKNDHLPFDFKVTAGDALVECRQYSGISSLRRCGPGSEIGAGSRIIKGSISGHSLGKFKDSNFSQFWFQVEKVYADAAMDQSESYRYTLPLLVAFLAACGFLFHYELTGELIYALSTLVAILFLAPLSLILEVRDKSTLMLYVKAFHRGLLVRGQGVLEKLSALKSFFLHFDEEKSEALPKVTSCELLDNRFDSQAVLSVILSMAGWSSDLRAESLVRFCLADSADLVLRKTTENNCLDGLGISAIIEGADFSLGTEEFLIQRGVQLSANEVKAESEGEFCWYLACNEDPIAIIHFEKGLFTEFREGFERLRSCGVRGILWSDSMTSQRADAVGKAFGLELSQVVNETDLEKLKRRFETSRPNAFLCEDYLKPQVGDSIDVWCSAFDDFRWNYESGDVLLLGATLSDLATTVGSIKKISKLSTRSWPVIVGGLLVSLLTIALIGWAPLLPLILCTIISAFYCRYFLGIASI